jgi:hypothetical protein
MRPPAIDLFVGPVEDNAEQRPVVNVRGGFVARRIGTLGHDEIAQRPGFYSAAEEPGHVTVHPKIVLLPPGM